jgi:hypothetical protein
MIHAETITQPWERTRGVEMLTDITSDNSFSEDIIKAYSAQGFQGAIIITLFHNKVYQGQN